MLASLFLLIKCISSLVRTRIIFLIKISLTINIVVLEVDLKILDETTIIIIIIFIVYNKQTKT